MPFFIPIMALAALDVAIIMGIVSVTPAQPPTENEKEIKKD